MKYGALQIRLTEQNKMTENEMYTRTRKQREKQE